jgi:hypothetical protein
MFSFSFAYGFAAYFRKVFGQQWQCSIGIGRKWHCIATRTSYMYPQEIGNYMSLLLALLS